jgi:hypothetical protein
MIEVSPLEKAILDDVQRKTGLGFPRVEGINTRDGAVARAVLPVLAGWVGRLDDPRYREAVYSRFHTQFAHAHFETILQWWTNEADSSAAALLTQVVASTLACEDAPRVWKLCHERYIGFFRHLLLAKLADCPAVSRDVREELLLDLRTKDVERLDLVSISRVEDPGIRDWFLGQVNSSDRFVRMVAKKVAARTKALPRGLDKSLAPPNRQTELFSTECDLDQVKPLLGKLAEDFQLRLPATLRKAEFVWSLESDCWTTVKVATTAADVATLWFRMEDSSTVEVLLLRGDTAAKPAGPN